jgi:predicted kinase
MQAVIFVGIQGSGKSTFYQQRFSNTHLLISLDPAGTRPCERRLLEHAIAQRRDFVIDNTNPTPAARRAYTQPALAAGYEAICYYFPPDLPNAIRRNEARTGKSRIPKVGLYTTAKRLVPPSPSEGFHHIYSATLQPSSTPPEENFIITQLSP